MKLPFHKYSVLTFRQFTEAKEPLKLTFHHPEPGVFDALHNGKKVAQAGVWKDLEHGKPSIYKSATKENYRRKGVMSQLYRHIENHIGTQLTPSSALSDEGHAFWQQYRPEAVKDDLRNHRDKLLGKTVTHPKFGTGVVNRVGSKIAMIHKKETGTEFPANRELLKSHGYIDESYGPRITGNDNRYDLLRKGWMNPSGRPHYFESHGEHSENHHPEIVKKVARMVTKAKKEYDHQDTQEHRFSHNRTSINSALSLGYARFGSDDDGDHYIHFDHKAKGGVHSALHALREINPKYGSSIYIEHKPWSDNNREANHKCDSPSKAAAHIRDAT